MGAPVCLSIGSSDSSGGAGIQADIKAMAAVGCYAGTVLVGTTAQTPDGLFERNTIPLAHIRSQLRAVRALAPQAVKVGTTWSVEVIELIAEELAPMRAVGVPIVIDPVMVTASGGVLAGGDELLDAVRSQLLPLATVVTPNRGEGEALASTPPGSERSQRQLAASIHAAGAAAVVVTAGEQDDGDWFFDGTAHRLVPGSRRRSRADHGAGCSHSAALCALLARGVALDRAVDIAHRMASDAVRDGHIEIGVNRHPVNILGLGLHFAALGRLVE
ncbi:bifunctional hydroxymethylpyrimidine kinase/phosphomethylpyrimidine kinase [Microbacteriaceae bacterium VKM Ac-2854]|nr:bifunctional hydroxymethylpyrimidine kinase/phosphomethylpyrimidine kinase [Microbacteriaceae bacterium VKM Ac-2854]